jgi:ribose transport system ATP-binding protein
MEEIFEIGDRASVLRDGKLVGTEVINRSSTSKLISMMVGRNLDEKFYKEKVPINDVIWRGEHLSSETGLIQDVNLEVRSGEILGLAGIRGSGYKELARMIGGADKISDGYLIDKENRKYRFNDPIDAISAGIGYLPDDRKGEGLILMLSIRQNITLPILNRISSGGWVNYDKTVKIANRYAKDLNIQAPSTDRSVEFLSGGNQQKVVMAKWLASGCRLLVLDGPTQGIDVGAKIEMYRLIASHVSAGGAVILVSSELPELMAIADRVMVIRDGRKVGEVIPDKSNQEEVLHMATAGEALN